MVSGRRMKVPTPLLSMVRRRKPIASAAGGFAGSTVPERALPKTGSLDMVMEMEKDGHFGIERPVFTCGRLSSYTQHSACIAL